MTREEWLEKVVEELRPIYTAAEVPIPEKVRVATGWPSRNALGTKSRRMAECWMVESAEDAVNQIYISPLIGDGAKAVRVLAHELVHAHCPTGAGHKAPFIKACKKVGITEGSPKSAEPGPELMEKISQILSTMELYPHAALIPRSVDKKQTTRMAKLICIGDSDASTELHEEYILRGSRKTIALGLPVCPLCNCEMKSEDAEESGEKKED